MSKVSRSKQGMIVAAHPLAAEAGREILAEGGTAVEAAVAACLTLGVVEPFASGLGGGGYMLIHRPITNTRVQTAGGVSEVIDKAVTEIIDFRGLTSSLHTEEYVYPKGATIPWQPKTGPMSATIPGQGRGFAEALRRYGSGIALSRLTQRAIEAAANGFEVSEVYSYVSGLFEGTVRAFPDAAKIHFKDGRRRKPGDKLVQTELAEALEVVAAEGFETLYTGAIGFAMTKAVNATGPVWGDKDLERYSVKTRAPLIAQFGDTEIATMGPPSRGGAGIVQSLLRWQHADIKSLGHNTAESILLMGDTFKLVFRALEPVIGDPDIFPIDLAALVSPDFDPELAAHGPKVGTSASTTHVTAVDQTGMIAAVSTTIGHFWGAGTVVPGWGILLNDDISDMERGPGKRNSVGASRRSVSNMAPTIVFRQGRPWFALGTPGSLRIFPAMSQVVSNMLIHGMDLEQAVAAGRIHFEDETLWLEGDIDPAVRAKVKQTWRGKVVERRARDLFFGGVHAAAIEPDGTVVGVADPRRDGVAAAV